MRGSLNQFPPQLVSGGNVWLRVPGIEIVKLPITGLVLKTLRLLSESKFQTTNVRFANAWHNLLDDKVTVFPKTKRNGFVQV